MVRMPIFDDLRIKSVKMEVEDSLEDEHGPLNKRSRQEYSEDSATASSLGGSYNPLDEPSPLGLRLRKSPSLLQLIQMRLSQQQAAVGACMTSTASIDSAKKDVKSTAVSAATDKMKASNFPASLLRIGSWEYVSRYEGDLVAKCYYAKHKLVWEVLEGGLKSKIEIQWSDITAIKATFSDNGPSTLDVVLARQPLFFKETNPQPRKHTLWQATSDFTGGQASIQRRHILQCPQGLLNKHFEKLIQCDPRLNALSQQPDIILESPHFEPRCSDFEEDEYKCHSFNTPIDDNNGSKYQGYQEHGSPSAAPSTSTTSEVRDSFSRVPELGARECRSPSSAVDARIMDESMGVVNQGPRNLIGWGQFRFPGLRPSMSKQDLVSHMEHYISEKNSHIPANNLPSKAALEDLAEYLLSDSQATTSEEGLMSRVNSFCCLIQNAGTAENLQMNNHQVQTVDLSLSMRSSDPEKKPLLELSTADEESPSSKHTSNMSREESFGDLLLHLPRIASFPQFLFNICEDGENQAR